MKTRVFRPILNSGVSLLLVLAALAPNAMARTRFTLSPSQPIKAVEAPKVVAVDLSSPGELLMKTPHAEAMPSTQPKPPAFWDTRKRTQRLNQLLSQDPLVKQSHLKAMVTPKGVLLQGTAYSPIQTERALALLQPEVGDLSIKDRSVVVDQLPPKTEDKHPWRAKAKDSQTEAIIRLRLLRAGLTRGTQIAVESTEGVVVLDGKVNSDSQKRRAAFLAETLPGVTQVINRLEER